MGSNRSLLPYGRHSVDEADIAAVADVLRGDWLTMGPVVTAFEEGLAKAVEARHAASCSSGTAALHLAALAVGLGENDVAIVPTMTFLATANCNRLVGAEVVFADVNPRTGLMDAEHLLAALARAKGRRVKAVFPVHMNGQCANLDEIRSVADAHGLVVIEDACHALGTVWRSGSGEASKIGSCSASEMVAFSFHPVKTIAAGEAGAVTTNDVALHRRVLQFRNHGMVRDAKTFMNSGLAFDENGAPNPWYYEMPEPGLNYRLSDIHAALGRAQLAKLEKFSARRRALAARYDSLLATLSPVVQPVARTPGCEPVWHLYVVQFDFKSLGIPRAALMHSLRAVEIGTQVHYIPVHLQPYYQARYGPLELPGAMAYYESALSLPLYPGMVDEDVDRVVEELARCINRSEGRRKI